MQKMHISFTKDLKNSEFHELFILLDKSLDDENQDNHLLQKAAAKIKHCSKQLHLLRSANPGHCLTKVIDNKVQKRTEYLACLRMKIDADLLSHIPANRIEAEKLKFWHNNYKKELHAPSIFTQGNLVKAMMQEIKEYTYLQNAVTELKLDGLLAEIVQLTNDIENAFLQRLKEVNHNKSLSKGLREKAYKDLQLLVNAIEIMYSISTDDDEREEISDLSKELSNLFTDFRTLLRSRKTKIKNKKEINATIKELIEGDEVISDTVDEPSPAKSNLPMVIYDELKIVAKQTKSITPHLYEDVPTKTAPVFKLPKRLMVDALRHSS